MLHRNKCVKCDLVINWWPPGDYLVTPYSVSKIWFRTYPNIQIEASNVKIHNDDVDVVIGVEDDV